MEEHFINRTEILNIIETYFSQFNIDDADMFKVLYIFGFGGMGKTYLLKYLKKKFLETMPSNMIIHITFEIQENVQMLYSLIKLRKAFNHSCPVFDYALLYYWDLEHIERLNDDFLKLIKSDIISAYTDLGLDLASSVLKGAIPSFSDIQNIINDFYLKITSYRIKAIIAELQRMEASDIYEKLPVYLASDIKDYMEEKHKNYFFLFDSYQQSIPYSKSEEWLLTFINKLQKGLFIITGREKLKWETEFYKIEKYYLDCYPEDEAKKFLSSVIPDSRKDILDTIIQSSGCIPIYVSLAYDLYLKEKNISTDELIKKSKFKDRALLVRHFINHLKKEWQELIIYLAVVKIFNVEVFDYLIDDLNLPCSKLDFDEIVNVSLFKYIENSYELYKLHDIFCANAISVLTPNIINRIWSSYLAFLSKRDVYRNLINQKLDSMITLFINVVELCIKYSAQINLNDEKIESIIDLFLVLSDTRMIFPIPKPSMQYSSEINDFLYFMDAILYEKVCTNDTIYKLKQIKNPKLFGKHIQSYNIVLKYAESLNGHYRPLKNYLETLEKGFDNSEKGEWYYLKTYIYLSDYYMMEGEFIKAYNCLLDLRNSVSLEIFNTDNYFLLERSIGHIYRFNYDFEAASKKYETLLAQYRDNPSLKTYLLVNLCETKCFTQPHYVLEKFHEALYYVDRFHNLKNKAKLYYSRGIAYTLLRKYSQALADIKTSIQINQRDGYRSGELFAYQAKAFYEYGKTGSITQATNEKLEQLINSNGVYEFLKYPIHLIDSTVDTMKEVNWLDAKNTQRNCEDFLKRLRS